MVNRLWFEAFYEDLIIWIVATLIRLC